MNEGVWTSQNASKVREVGDLLDKEGAINLPFSSRRQFLYTSIKTTYTASTQNHETAKQTIRWQAATSDVASILTSNLRVT